MTQFDINITRDAGEIEEAQRLRFRVFNLEMKKGLEASFERGLDVDAFDARFAPGQPWRNSGR